MPTKLDEDGADAQEGCCQRSRLNVNWVVEHQCVCVLLLHGQLLLIVRGGREDSHRHAIGCRSDCENVAWEEDVASVLWYQFLRSFYRGFRSCLDLTMAQNCRYGWLCGMSIVAATTAHTRQ